MSQPTIGRIVHYTLSELDVIAITARREQGDDAGNFVAGGDVYPATIVRVWTEADNAPCNLQVHLDGNDVHWATSRSVGEGAGTWAWPPRV